MAVPHHARGARLARHQLAAELDTAVSATLLADAISVLAELVGNSIRHADPLPGGLVQAAWRLRPAQDRWVVVVQVTDGGAGGAPVLRCAGADAVDGRGLRIVTALADRWGIERDGLGQRVWAELSGGAPPPGTS